MKPPPITDEILAYIQWKIDRLEGDASLRALLARVAAEQEMRDALALRAEQYSKT